MIHIGISGAHFVGKTTLVQSMANAYGPRIHLVTGIARGVIESNFQLGKEATIDSYVALIGQYLQAKREAEASAKQVAIWDRTLLDTLCYSRVNARLGLAVGNHVSKLLEEIWQDDRPRFSALSIVPIEFPLPPASLGALGDDEYRLAVQTEILTEIGRSPAPHIVLKGDQSQRAELLRTVIDRYFG